jgi:PAS domain S-box-containing protein
MRDLQSPSDKIKSHYEVEVIILKRNSIKFRIPFLISLFALMCVMVTGVIFLFIFRLKFEESIARKNLIISEMVSDELSLYLENATDTVITSANFSTQSHGDLNKIKEEIFRIYDNFDYFDLIFFMNRDAQMVFSKPSNENVQGRLYTDRDYYWDIFGSEKTHTLSKLLVSSVLNKPHFIIAAPVRDSQSEVMGLIGAGIPLSNIEEIVSRVDMSFDGKIWLSDGSGSLFIHPDYKMTDSLIKIDTLGIEQVSNGLTIDDVLKRGVNENLRYTASDHNYYAAVTFVEGSDWMVVVEQDETTVNREIYDTLKQMILIQIIVIFFALLLGFVMANWITAPIEQLVQYVRGLPNALSKKEQIAVAPLEDPNSEIAELSHAFSEMGNQLSQNIEELEDAILRENRIQQYLNNILASVHSGIIVADSSHVITMMNDQAKKITGIPELEVVRYHFFELLKMLELDIEESIREVIECDAVINDMASSLRDRAGNELIISYSCSRVTDRNGNNIGTVLQFRDITRIKAIENELKKEDRIHTLGELSASIIHDIGNPLAGMSTLIELLKKPELSGESQEEVLSLLSEEVNDLNILVINFLDFVRSGEVERKPRDLTRTVKSCIELFKGEFTEDGLRLVKSLPEAPVTVNIESRSIKQAIINIIKNAIQATEGRGTVTIALTVQDKTATLEISDDGKGMTEETKSKLFHPFYTTKQDGTGLGLFIAYNALKENGCLLTVSSELGHGTQFKIVFKKESSYDHNGSG